MFMGDLDISKSVGVEPRDQLHSSAKHVMTPIPPSANGNLAASTFASTNEGKKVKEHRKDIQQQ